MADFLKNEDEDIEILTTDDEGDDEERGSLEGTEDVISLDGTEEESAPQETEGDEGAKEKKKKQSVLADVFDTFETFCHALVLMMLIFAFVLRFVTVDGGSMTNTLLDKDKLIISDLFYTPETGDIVVLNAENVEGLHQKYIIKRIIATGGQKVVMNYENWSVSVDGKVLKEDYVRRDGAVPMRAGDFAGFDGLTKDKDGNTSFTVPEGMLFVMGDNRNGSTDSRLVGFFEEERLLGRVLFRVAPLGSFGIPG